MINYKNLIFEMNKELKLNLENKSNFKMEKVFRRNIKNFFFSLLYMLSTNKN